MVIRTLLRDITSPESRPIDRILTAIVLLSSIIATVLAGFLLFILINSAGITTTGKEKTVVEAKQIVYNHSTSIISRKPPIITSFSSDSYQLCFKIKQQKASYEVSKDFYESVKIGDGVEVTYGIARLTRSLQPTGIRKITSK